MRRKHGPRMLAKARGKYGKPNYPGREVKEKSRGGAAEDVVRVVSTKESANNIDANVHRIWDEIKKVVYEEVSPVSYETWIDPCEPLMIADDRIVLMVENVFFKEMLEKRYVAFLQKVAEKVMSVSPVKIEVVTSPT